MRPITNFTLHAILAAALTAFAATSAAAAGYIKLGDMKGQESRHKPALSSAEGDHKGEIEILSYSFGPRQSTSRVSKADGFAIKQQATPYKLKPVFVKSWSTSGDAAAQPHGAGINQMSMDDTAGKEKNPVGASKTETIGIARSPDAASGQATGKRTHKPLRMRMEYDGGSVTVGGRLAGCTAGTAYNDALIDAGGERFEMEDVVVASCGPDSTTLNFAKVKVRGWDPEKKEE